eukprot:5719680-Pyramimonas_sp.AAC.1
MGWGSLAFSRRPARRISASRRAMCCVKFLPVTKPCCALWVRSVTNGLMRWFAAPAIALMSMFFGEGGRVSSGGRSVVMPPRRLSPFGKNAKSKFQVARGRVP